MQQYSLILSTSLVNARKHGVFAGDAGGIVLSPRSTVLCAYPYDGGAMNFANGCGPSWCSEPDNIWGCAFPPSMLYRMQQIHEGGPQWPYNEVVVDANGIIIEAVFGGRGGAAEAMHARLIAHFGLTANQLPFLGFSGRARSNRLAACVGAREGCRGATEAGARSFGCTGPPGTGRKPTSGFGKPKRRATGRACPRKLTARS